MRIFSLVVALHVVFLVVLSIMGPKSEKKKQIAKVKVHEMQLQEHPILEEAIAELPLPPAPPAPVQEKAPEAVVEEKPPPPPPQKPVVKKEAPKKTPPPVVKKEKPKKPVAKPAAPPKKKKQNERDAKLAGLLKNSLSSLGKTGKTTLPQNKIGPLLSESLKGEVGTSYEEEIALYLKYKLQLPELGEVRIKLTLSSNGKVSGVKIITGSEKNKSLVEKKVPNITFPPFDSRLEGEKSHTFSVTLKSNA